MKTRISRSAAASSSAKRLPIAAGSRSTLDVTRADRLPRARPGRPGVRRATASAASRSSRSSDARCAARSAATASCGRDGRIARRPARLNGREPAARRGRRARRRSAGAAGLRGARPRPRRPPAAGQRDVGARLVAREAELDERVRRRLSPRFTQCHHGSWLHNAGIGYTRGTISPGRCPLKHRILFGLARLRESCVCIGERLVSRRGAILNAKHFFWAPGQAPQGTVADSTANDLVWHGGNAGAGAIGVEQKPPSTRLLGPGVGRPASRPPTPTGSSTRRRRCRTT